MKFHYVPAMLLTLGMAAPVSAEPGDRMIEHLDKNGDKAISLEEFQPPGDRGRNRFEKVDANGDGAISKDEMTAARAARAEEMERRMAKRGERMDEAFDTMDADNDGVVTREEMRVAAFRRMDRNNDGVLTADEIRPPRGMRGHPGHHDHEHQHDHDQQ